MNYLEFLTMIIELKDIPEQPIKKLDIHIEFSDNGITVSKTFLNESKQVQNDPKKTSNESKEPSDIPQEMLNADF